MSDPIPVIIHGHFYQPPRENPWTGRIERQESAAPYHDWNERVAAECYTPNARSRVLDHQGRILEVVNNYAHLSYNFGPTLLCWLEEHLPDTYARILAADAASAARLGAGGAMAQVYNHVIMPLADPRDRKTQIRWGLADFEARFGRPARGMWLAETAVNDAVLEDLAAAGLEFTILAPSQAELIRAPGEAAWREVADGSIPTGRAYRWTGRRGELALLFYDAGLSRAVAFEGLLRNADDMAQRLAAAGLRCAEQSPDGGGLVCVATDGESYGHHAPMGDMCLAYLAAREAERRGLALTNPAAYLAAHPPRWQVQLKAGQAKLGTAWSCAHGTGRWRRDCGCTTGGPPSWNQAWREPLRQAFDLLRQRMDPLFEQRASRLLDDPWAARDDYIEVLLGRTVGAAERFLDRHARRPLDEAERAEVFRLLEMQHHGMLMYTSCGWFFADLSGIETVQDLAYFARAAQLGELAAGHPISADSLDALGRARSNLPEMGSGVDLLARFVRPAMLSPAKVAAHLGIRALLEQRPARDRLYAFRARSHDERRAEHDGLRAFTGRLTTRAERTGEGGTFEVVVLAGRALQLAALVRGYSPQQPSAGPQELLARVGTEGFAATCDALEADYDLRLGLPDMLSELRLQAMDELTRGVRREVAETIDALYARHEGLLRSLRPLGVRLPESLRAPVAYAVGRRFDRLIERGLQSGDLRPAAELAALGRDLGAAPPVRRAERLLQATLAERLERILDAPDPQAMVAWRELLAAGRGLGLEPAGAALQDRVAEVFDRLLDALLDPERPGGPWQSAARAWVELAGHLNLEVESAAARLKRV